MINRTNKLAFTLAAVLASLPAMATAQMPTGRSGMSTEREVGEYEYWNAMRSFGRCFARAAPSAAFDFLATEPGSRDEVAIYNRLFAGRDIECLGDISRMSVLIPFVRGTIAEGLLLLGTPVPARLALNAPAPGAPIRTLTEVSLCYAAAHPGEARAMIAGTRPGSRQEAEALTQIHDDLFRCLPPEGRNYRFRPTEVRYHLAEALLRLPAVPERAAH